ncbi:MAG: 30S ribosomal protein S16 [Actinomycetia bacterium]|nr:30S ribosomal protein S16 [Actinomycetes bacterium]
MAVKIRLTRLGKKKQPTYRVVVIDSRKQRDGKYIEQLGFYDPRQDPSVVEIDNERALYWLRTGAQPTERAQKLLEISGAWTQFRVSRGDIHTIGADDAQDAPAPKAVVVDEVEEAVETEEVVEAPAEAAPKAAVEAEEATQEVVDVEDATEDATEEVVEAKVEVEETETTDSSEEA